MNTARTRGLVVVCSGCSMLLMTPAPAEAQIASALLRENEELIPGETISALNNTAVNHVGGFACSANTVGTGTISRVWGNPSGGPGMLLRSEQTIGNLEQTSFESFYGMADAGQLVYSAVADNSVSGVTGLDGAWLDDLPVLVEEDPVPTLPGQFSSFNSRPGATGDGVPWWVGGITTVQGGSTQVRVLFRGVGSDPVIMGGDSVSGIAELVAVQGIDFDFRVSRFGTNWIDLLMVNSGSTLDDGVMVINGAVLLAGGSIVRENSPVPAAVGGLANELWDNFDFQGINEAGNYLVTGDTNAATTEDEFVLWNGEIILRESAVLELDGMPVTVAGAIEGGYMNAQADWAVTWDVDTAAANIEALIYNGRIVLAEGDAVDWNGDGVIDGGDGGGVLANFTGISTLTVGARQNGVLPIYFTADIEFSGTLVEGFFRLEVTLADINGDGIVNASDLALLLGDWGPYEPCPPNIAADLDGDCDVDSGDLALLLGNWGPVE